MDFSQLLSSGSLLYVGLGIIVLVIATLSYKFLSGNTVSHMTPVATAISTGVAVTNESQTLTQAVDILPSTEVISTMPALESASVLPVVEIPKGELPPLSSWKPSSDAAPIPSKDDIAAVPSSLSGSLEEKPTE